ncbi:hypothetical protein pdul_cds_818 [Pandoravirus dulcis]|uniref:Uncharacterized protein n=1 Tax=Pandoravirus dulcis TaxID=1349409 RepID=S4VUF2_9VIRU|nr:hypothetical protein pdul_cds_818 [Pandoravirus dulcis]AGO83025.1 hypothetical protein pdul_cds_818 [Pandoravirus dulcis]
MRNHSCPDCDGAEFLAVATGGDRERRRQSCPFAGMPFFLFFFYTRLHSGQVMRERRTCADPPLSGFVWLLRFVRTVEGDERNRTFF